jgi:hypothetical protein
LSAGNLSFSSLEGEFEEDLCQWAKDFQIDIVAGTLAESATKDKEAPRYNAAMYISRQGKILAVRPFLSGHMKNHSAFETALSQEESVAS